MVVTVALAVALSVGGCGSADTGEQAATSTTSTPPTSAPPATLPDDAFDDITDDTLGTPDPPLPGDIRPQGFEVGTLAALGNVEIQMVSVEQPGTDPASPSTLRVRLRVTNGSLEDLELRRQSFSVYLADGSAVPADDDSGGELFDGAFGSTTTVEGELTFTIPDGSRPIMMLFDSAGYGDRVFSGGFVVGV